MKKRFSSTWVHFEERLPEINKLGSNVILFYDKKMASKNLEARKWIGKVDKKIALPAGESVKTLNQFKKTMQSLLKLTQNSSTTDLTFVAMGGGSIGDFVGFLASTFKRGVRLVHIPTTWLAAIDSAHGGKTALNFNSVKNQIGTFYPAQQIWICKSVLVTLGTPQVNDGWAEVIKLGFIDSKLFSKVENAIKAKSLWSVLPLAVSAKYRIVAKDPFEKNGHRRLLNFGHTMGHVLESHYKISHGQAVAGGTLFAINMSYQLGLMSLNEFWKCVNSRSHQKLFAHFYQNKNYKTIPVKQMSALLLQDKKKTASHQLKYILLNKIGKATICSMDVGDIVEEYQRQIGNGSF